MQIPYIPQGGGCVQHGALQKYFAQGVSLLYYQFYKSPPLPGRGGVGLDIDRCITFVRGMQ